MNRLVEAKVELAEARERCAEAEKDYEQASLLRRVGEVLDSARRKREARHTIQKLVAEIAEAEALEEDFGPGAAEEAS